MKSARDLERELFQSALGAEFATSISPPEIVIPIADDGTIDVVAIQRLEELFNTAARRIDLFEPLLLELMLVDFPSFKLDQDSLPDRMRCFRHQYIGENQLRLAGSWARYADGTITHLLRPIDHYRLRTSRNRGLLSSADQQRISEAKIAIAGLSVGGMTATTLAMEGFRDFYLTDFDVLSCSNLNRLASSLTRVGTQKADIVAEKIWDIDPFAKVVRDIRGYSAQVEDEIFSPAWRPDVFVDAMDSIDGKIAVREACRKHGVPVVWMMDVGDGVVQIGCERYDLDPTLPLFDGRLSRKEKQLGRNLNYAESIISIVNPEYLGPRMLESFQSACKSEIPGVPQIAGTVAVSAGAISQTIRRVLLGDAVTPEFSIEIAEKADPEYTRSIIRSRAEAMDMLRGMGLLASIE